MRRFLGGNTNGNSSAAGSQQLSPTTPTSELPGGNEPAPTSATKRALQQFGQSAFSKGFNGVVRKASLPFSSISTPESEVPPSIAVSSESVPADGRATAGHPNGLASSSSSGRSPPAPPSKSPYLSNGSTAPDEGDDPDGWDAIRLPFGNSETASSMTTASETPTLRKSDVSSLQSRLTLSNAYAINASSLVDVKDDMMMELLSSDALLHVGQFEILGFDEVEELRKEHSLLTNRLNILNNKLVVEMKIRDAAISLSRLYTSKRMSRQADDTLDSATRKVEAVENELNRIARREAEVRTRILRHMAAVLGLMLRRIEGSTYSAATGNGHSSAYSPKNTPLPLSSDQDLLSPSSMASATFSSRSSSTRTTAAARFEGPHLFAGHKGATIPNARSPFSSPHLSSSTGTFSSLPYGQVPPSPALSSAATHLPYASPAGLDTRIQELTDELLDTKARVAEHLRSIDTLHSQKDHLERSLHEMEEKSASAQRRMEDAQLERSRQLQDELESVREELQHSRTELEARSQDSNAMEHDARQRLDEQEAERQELARALQETLQKHAASDSPFARHLPDPRSLNDPDVHAFVTRHLDTLLSDVAASYIGLRRETEALQDQLRSYEQDQDSTSTRNAAELSHYKRQIDSLEQEKTSLTRSVSLLSRDKAGLDRALQDLQRESDERHQASSARANESERVLTQRLQEAERALASRGQETEQEKRTLRGRLENLQSELQEIRQSKQDALQALQQVWQILPDDQVISTRLGLRDTDELAKYKSAFAPAQSSSSSRGGERASFSAESLANKIEGVLSAEQRLLSRLIAYEQNASTHKLSAERAQKLLQESTVSLQTYATQMKEMEERAEVSGTKEVQMLERLNDLQDALEHSRSAAKRAEAKVVDLERQCAALDKEKSQLLNKPDESARYKKEAEDVREELAAAQDELDDLRNKESRQRVQLLEELTTLSEEASSLRTQLRAAQRKLKEAGKA